MQARHDEDVGRAAQARERVVAFAHIGIECDVGRHLALVLEVGVAHLVEQANRLARALGQIDRRVAEVRIAEKRDARLGSHLARLGGRLPRDGDHHVGFGARVDRGVGDEQGAVAQHVHRKPEELLAGHGVDHAADIVEAGEVAARQPRHHCVGGTVGHHAGGEHVAVLVHVARAVPVHPALALVAGIQEVDVLLAVFRQRRIVDRQVVHRTETEFLDSPAHHLLAPDQNGFAQPGIAVGNGGADHAFGLALGEDHPLGVGAHRLEGRLDHR